MTIVYPANRQEVVDRILTDIQNELPELNPFLRASIIRALGVSNAGRLYDLYTQQNQAQNERFVDTATDVDFIRRHGLFKGIDVNPASVAKGFITATGTPGSIIDAGTLYQTESQVEYEVINQNYVINQTILVVKSLTRSGTTVTAIFNSAHNFASNINVLIAGADQGEYNGTFPITVTSEDSFTYEITGTPVTPATGSITATADTANVEVESVGTGSDKNLGSGAKLSLKTPIAGVDDDAYVQFTKISGGTDEETIDEYRARVLEIYANPISNFNAADITKIAKSIPGVTRVWVFDATPDPGDCEIYFVRDNDDDIIPDPSEISTVKDEILKIKTAPMRDEDVHVYAPTKVQVDFIFNDLDPDSQTMRDAIEDNLRLLFKDVPNVSEDLIEDAYRSAIYQTLNPETGEFVKTFALSAPVGDITVNDGELAVLGNITWNL
jgi:uncharacterized phage protein gp47/JayE